MATLIVISGKQKGEYLPLGRRTSVVGRAESLPLQILDEGVSRRHFRVCFDEGSKNYYAEDMDSGQGTFVNKHRITQKTYLAEDDQILVGETRLLFTKKDFDTQESELMHCKKVGEKSKETQRWTRPKTSESF